MSHENWCLEDDMSFWNWWRQNCPCFFLHSRKLTVRTWNEPLEVWRFLLETIIFRCELLVFQGVFLKDDDEGRQEYMPHLGNTVWLHVRPWLWWCYLKWPGAKNIPRILDIVVGVFVGGWSLLLLLLLWFVGICQSLLETIWKLGRNVAWNWK